MCIPQSILYIQTIKKKIKVHTVTNNLLKYIDKDKEYIVEFADKDGDFYLGKLKRNEMNVVFDLSQSTYLEPQYFDVVSQELLSNGFLYE